MENYNMAVKIEHTAYGKYCNCYLCGTAATAEETSMDSVV